MDDLNFTEEEIREQLEKLGYVDVPTSRLAEFKRGKKNGLKSINLGLQFLSVSNCEIIIDAK